jgi:uncharacterized membrane protein YfbV (UPF0208 family)
MKKSATSRKEVLDSTDHILAGSGTVATDTSQDLAQLIWKYFREEITQALQEAQQALAPVKNQPRTAKSRKR